MSECHYAIPVMIQDGKAAPLHRVAFDETFPESWIQELLYAHPELIRFEELEPAFKGSVAVAREVESGSGPVDLLCVNADGLLTIVETKLWRNPQARREVVSQLIDYAASLARVGYEELVSAVQDSAESTGDPLIDSLRRAGQRVDEQRFHDAVSRNLKHGRFLLLAIGDGIQEGVETMADFLQKQPHLGFTLRLVEMGLFRAIPGNDDLIFVQPRVVARTREVIRAIVELRGDNRIEVSTPPEDQMRSGQRFTITEEEFFRQLRAEVELAEVEFLQRILRQAPDHHLTVEWKQSGPLLKYFDNERNVFFTLGGFDCSGYFLHLERFWSRCDELGLPAATWTDYFDALVRQRLNRLLPSRHPWLLSFASKETYDRRLEMVS